MQSTHVESTASQQAEGPAQTFTLDSLARMSVAELTEVYRGGSLPDAFSALDGTPRGRMLTAAGPFGRVPIAGALRRFAQSRVFPWAGKSFTAQSGEQGTGVNRVRLGKTREWYPFDTRLDASAIDGAPCILLDYDKPENPFFIRKIRDELREVSPGMFLGPAMWRTSGDPKLLLYFAIDHTGH